MSMPWIGLDGADSGRPVAVALYNYCPQEQQQQHLRLVVGDKLALVSQYTNWYYGHLWSDSSKKGVFPKSHVRLLEAAEPHQRRFQSPAAAGVISEIQRTLPNWLNCISRQFEDLRRPLPDLGQAAELFRELREMAQHLESVRLTAAEATQQAAVATRKLDSGNQAYGFDTVMRNSRFEEVANPFEFSFVGAFKHMDETAKTVMITPAPDARLTVGDLGFQATPVRFESACPETLEITLTLRASYNRTLKPSAWEPVAFVSEAAARSSGCRTSASALFGEVLRLDGSDFVLVAQICRHGKLDPPKITRPLIGGIIGSGRGSGSGHAGGPAGSGLFRRPFAVATFDLSQVPDSTGEPVTLTSNLVPITDTKDERLTLDELTAKRSDERNGCLALRVQRVAFRAATAAAAVSADSADAPPSLVVARRLELGSGPRVAEQRRNLAYLRLATAELERSSNKHSEPNVELAVQVCDKAGKPVSGVLGNHRLSLHGDQRQLRSQQSGDEYRSVIFYHNGHPRWDELIRLHLDSIMDNLASHHVRFEIRHRSSKARGDERPIGYSVLFLHNTFHQEMLNATPCLQKDGEYKLTVFEKAPLMTDRDLTRRYLLSPTPEDPKARRNSLTVSLGQCSTELSTNWRVSSLLHLRLEAVQREHLHFSQDDQRDAAAFFPRLLRCVLGLLPDPRLEASAFGTLLCLLAPYSTAAAGEELEAVLADLKPDDLPPDVHEPVLRHLAEGLKADFKAKESASGGQQQQPGSEDPSHRLYQATRSLLRIAVHSLRLRPERLQQPEYTQRLFEPLFTLLQTHRIQVNDAAQYRLVSSFFDDFLESFLQVLEPLWLGDQLLRLINSVLEREDRLPHSLFKFDRIVAKEAFWNSKLRPQLVDGVVKFVCDFIRTEERKPADSKHRGNLSMYEVVLRPFNELLAILSRLDEASVAREVQLVCCEKRFLRTLVQTCASIAFEMPLMNFQVKANTEPKFIRLFMVSIVSCLELLNRSPDLWQLWIDSAIFAGSHFYLPNDSSPTVNADDLVAKCELADQTNELLQLLTGVFINIEDRWMKWHDLKLLESRIILRSLTVIQEQLLYLFAKPLQLNVVESFLNCVFAFLRQPHLIYETFPTDKKEHHVRLMEGCDPRLAAFELVKRAWSSLAPADQLKLAMPLITLLLQVSLQRQEQLRCECAFMLVELLRCEFSQEKSIFGVSKEITFVMDKLVEEFGSKEYVENFSQYFSDALAKEGKFIQNGFMFQSEMRRQMDLLLEYKTLIADELPENRMFAIYNLYKFYKEINKEEMCNRYLYKLCQLHESAGNWAEAGCVLLLQAKYLEWADSPLSISKGALQKKYQICRSQGELKGTLIWDAIGYFEKGNLFHKAKQQAEVLWHYYKDILVDFAKEREALDRMAALCQSITNVEQVHAFNSYYLVEFKGPDFPNFLRDRKFIYCGIDSKKLADVIETFETLFPYAKIPQNKQDRENYSNLIEISAVTAVPRPPPNVGDTQYDVLQYYENNEVQHFIQRKMQVRTEKVTEKVCTIDTFESMEPFPSVLRLLPASHVKSATETPLQSAVRDNETMNKKLKYSIYQLVTGRIKSSQGLVGLVSGIVCATVGGGIDNFMEFFQVLDDIQTGLDTTDGAEADTGRLAQALAEQLSLCARALDLCKEHGTDVQAYAGLLLEKLEMVQGCTGMVLQAEIRQLAEKLAKPKGAGAGGAAVGGGGSLQQRLQRLDPSAIGSTMPRKPRPPTGALGAGGIQRRPSDPRCSVSSSSSGARGFGDEVPPAVPPKRKSETPAVLLSSSPPPPSLANLPITPPAVPPRSSRQHAEEV
ncbi:hypothetical protein BOX15_Mlig008420g2 [Macrostomum lignano]|uniref:SH3 domain-containing protein n=1 Tax=Macrostomum lignano TaxID=282301 RepID=A0A267DZ59_9PLAT|nr:hypothetical protein BOX15_Mlig008420g2 [Macrostomum lignano]